MDVPISLSDNRFPDMHADGVSVGVQTGAGGYVGMEAFLALKGHIVLFLRSHRNLVCAQWTRVGQNFVCKFDRYG